MIILIEAIEDVYEQLIPLADYAHQAEWDNDPIEDCEGGFGYCGWDFAIECDTLEDAIARITYPNLIISRVHGKSRKSDAHYDMSIIIHDGWAEINGAI